MPQYAVFVKGRKKPIAVTSNSNDGAVMAARRAGLDATGALKMGKLPKKKKRKK